jgi:hypothetical protein
VGITVRWPGGNSSRHPVPAGSTCLVIPEPPP